MTAAQAGFAVAGVATALYGLLLLPQRPDWRRTVVKAAAVGALAVAARLADAPPLLALALALSAVGDAALAIHPTRTLPAGLTAFLLAHVTYVALFIELGTPALLLSQPWRLGGAIFALAAACALLRLLWPSLGALRAAVAAYAVAIAAMTAAALTLDLGFWPGMLGAALFMASDAILALRLFRYEGRPHLWADQAVWWLYAAAQGMIAWAFLRPWRL